VTAAIFTPLGPMRARFGLQGLKELSFSSEPVIPGLPTIEAVLLENELGGYFAGAGPAWSVRLDLQGTPFQLAVWRALLEIPSGSTVSYGGLAQRLGIRNGARAVGLAVGQNPIAVLVPCHRVLGAEGELRGYAYGVEIKKRLLALESGQPPLIGFEASAPPIAAAP
jgi:O-6-methylguanine DNA methyltransferase